MNEIIYVKATQHQGSNKHSNFMNYIIVTQKELSVSLFLQFTCRYSLKNLTC